LNTVFHSENKGGAADPAWSRDKKAAYPLRMDDTRFCARFDVEAAVADAQLKSSCVENDLHIIVILVQDIFNVGLLLPLWNLVSAS
jgi:hypothetical protein